VSPTINPVAGGSGGTPTYTKRASYSGNNVTISDGASAFLTWDSLGDGAALLDIATDPAHPTVLAGGIYAVSANVNASAFMTAGGFLDCVLHMDFTNDDAIADSNTAGTTAGDFARVSLALTWYVPPGGEISVRVFNRDGAASRPVQLNEVLIQLLPGGP
jgi:hypothetical protein